MVVVLVSLLADLHKLQAVLSGVDKDSELVRLLGLVVAQRMVRVEWYAIGRVAQSKERSCDGGNVEFHGHSFNQFLHIPYSNDKINQARNQ